MKERGIIFNGHASWQATACSWGIMHRRSEGD